MRAGETMECLPGQSLESIFADICIFYKCSRPSAAVIKNLRKHEEQSKKIEVLSVAETYLGNRQLLAFITFAAQCCPHLRLLDLSGQQMYSSAIFSVSEVDKDCGMLDCKPYPTTSDTVVTGNDVIDHLLEQFSGEFEDSSPKWPVSESQKVQQNRPKPPLTIVLKNNELGSYAANQLLLLARKVDRIVSINVSGSAIGEEAEGAIRARCTKNGFQMKR